MTRGLSEDCKTYELIDGTIIKIKEGVSSKTYFGIMDKWVAVEETTVTNVIEQFKKEKAERDVVIEIFKNYTEVTYKDLSDKQDYRELVTVAGEVFAFLGKSTNSAETSRLINLYQATQKKK